MHTATEAMVELLGLADRKRRGFFVVKGAAGHKIGTCLFKRHVPLDHIHDVEAVEQILNEAFWNHVNSAPAHNSQTGESQDPPVFAFIHAGLSVITPHLQLNLER